MKRINKAPGPMAPAPPRGGAQRIIRQVTANTLGGVGAIAFAAFVVGGVWYSIEARKPRIVVIDQRGGGDSAEEAPPSLPQAGPKA